MKQNRKNCAAIYLEDEYDKLVLEAYWQARDKNKMSNNRYRFNCIYCNESHKDKNTVSYHRMFNLCKSYRGQKPLKMYPTWEPSNHGEKHRIAAKFGKASSPHGSHSQSPSTFPPPLELDSNAGGSASLGTANAEHGAPSRKRKLPARAPLPVSGGRTRTLTVDIPSSSPLPRNLATKAAPKPPRSPSSPRRPKRRSNKKLPPRRTIISSSEEDLDSGTSPSESESSKDDTPESQNTADNSGQNSGHGQFRVVTHASGHRAQPSPMREEHIQPPETVQTEIIRASPSREGVVLNPAIDAIPQAVPVHDIVLQPEPPQEDVLQPVVPQSSSELVQHGILSRDECKQRAYEEATTLFQAHNELGQPPVPMPVDGLYILISETEGEWVPKHLLDDPDGCMQYLHKQVGEGIIGARVSFAFGRWYLYGNKKVCRLHVLQLHMHVLP